MWGGTTSPIELQTSIIKISQYHNDHLGGSNVITDESGQQVKYLEYHPYGETKVEEGSLDTAKKFTGKELDDSTGLYDYGARQYDSNIGRFISADTVIPNFINPQNLNRYSYCLNNPLKYTDSTGHTVDPWDPAFVFMDVGAYQADPSILNAAALGVDVVLAVVPAVPAVAGLVVRGAEKLINKIDDVIRAVDKVIDTVKGVDKAADAGKAVDKSIVIGETATRVEKKAKELGAEWYKPKKKIFEDPNIPFKQKAKNNINWYRKKVNEGYKVNDMGLDTKRSPEDRGRFYQEESRSTNKWLKEGRLKKGSYKKIK